MSDQDQKNSRAEQVPLSNIDHELEKLGYAAQLRETTDKKAATVAFLYACQQANYNAHLQFAQQTIDRMQKRAEFVEKASGTLATVYSALLGIHVTIAKIYPLPSRDFVLTLFFALAIVLAAVYLTYITPPKKSERTGSQSNPPSRSMVSKDMNAEPRGDFEAQVATVLHDDLCSFINWVSEVTSRRVSSLRSATINLGLGVVFFPIVFFSLSDSLVWSATIVSGIAALLIPHIPHLHLDQVRQKLGRVRLKKEHDDSSFRKEQGALV